MWKDGGVRFGGLSVILRLSPCTGFVTWARYRTFLLCLGFLSVKECKGSNKPEKVVLRNLCVEQCLAQIEY